MFLIQSYALRLTPYKGVGNREEVSEIRSSEDRFDSIIMWQIANMLGN
jgi:hypothetical protein